MILGLRLRALSFHGLGKEPAVVTFAAGLNVIYGASNTGKSFILNTIDYMLGGKPPLRDIPERQGYDRILLAIETLDGENFTVARSTDGGAFMLYEGYHAETLPESQGTILGDLHAEKREDNLSSFLLQKVGLSGRRIRKNRRGETQSLSFRNLARLILINEQEIIQERSPLSDGNVVADTANVSVFKLLLTGVDDSAFVVDTKLTAEDQSRGAQIDLLDQLIRDYQRQVRGLAGKPDELELQLDRLTATMTGQSSQLAASEASFRSALTLRRDAARKVEEANNRLTEITALLDRFALLDLHYRSDLERLAAIEEGGSLFAALAQVDCPLCGASPEAHKSSDCGGDVDRIVAAARAETAKVVTRRAELSVTMTTLREEAVSFERRLPRYETRLREVSTELETVISPNLKQLRSSYKELADKGGAVREALALHRSLSDFTERKAVLEREEEGRLGRNAANQIDGLSTSVVDSFAAIVQSILQSWHFPDAERVHFDLSKRDLVINGKSRTSYGKGLRAITQSAFTIGLMEYCKLHGTSHPGLVMLDSPLLSYREPDGEAGQDDDLRGSDLNRCFFDYISNLADDRQVIVIENTDPPAKVRESVRAIYFSGKAGTGRAGLFSKPS